MNQNFKEIEKIYYNYAEKTEKVEGKLIGKRWYGSRNIA